MICIDADAYVPFEPKTDQQRALRARLQDGLKALRPGQGEILHATFAGRLPGGADVENALFYNLAGRGAFDQALANGVAFELLRGRPPAACGTPTTLPYPMCGPDAAGSGRQSRVVRRRSGSGRANARGDSWALRSRSGAISVSGRRRHGEPFAMDLTLHAPVRSLRPGLIKCLLDGTICALQSQTDPPAPMAVERIASALAVPRHAAEAALLDPAPSALGPRPRLVCEFRQGVKWSPEDDLCIAARILIARAPRWRVHGVIRWCHADAGLPPMAICVRASLPYTSAERGSGPKMAVLPARRADTQVSQADCGTAA